MTCLLLVLWALFFPRSLTAQVAVPIEEKEPESPAETTVLSPAALADSLKEAENLARAYRFYESEALLRRYLPQAEEELGPSSVEFAQALDLLVMCLYQTGRSQSQETIELANRAVEIKSKALGPEDAETLRSLSFVGVIRAMGGHYAEADSIFSEVLRKREAVLPPDHRTIGVILSHLANVRSLQSDYSGALPLIRRALAIAEAHKGPTSPSVANMRMNLASTLVNLGDYIEARSVLDRQIELLEAEERLSEHLARAHLLMGKIRSLVGDPEDALLVYRRGLEIYEAIHPPENPRIAEALLFLGDAHLRTGERETARALVERGRAIWEKNHDSNHPYLTSYDHLLGRLAFEDGRLEDSRQHFDRALEIRRRSMGDDAPTVAEVLLSLGLVDIEEGRYKEARENLTRAIEIISTNVGPDHPRVSKYGSSLMEAYFLDGDFGRAAEQALEVERIFTKHLRTTLRALPERQALVYARQRAAALDLAFSLVDLEPVPGLTSRAWDGLIRSRALVLDEMAARHNPKSRETDPEAAARWEAYQQASTRLANLYVRGPGDIKPEPYRRLLDEARHAFEDAERRLTGLETPVRTTAQERIGWKEVRNALPRDAAMVAYVLYKQHGVEPAPSLDTQPRYLAFVLPASGGDPVSVDLGPAADVDARIADWKREVSLGALRADRSREESAQAYRETARSLRRAIWDPVADLVRPAGRIFVVPDGQIHLVNHAVLPREGGGFLVESDFTFHYLTSEREIAIEGEESPPPGGALVVGAPDFEETTAAGLFSSRDPHASSEGFPKPFAETPFRGERPDCGVFRSMRFDPLPEAREEAQEVAALWRSRLESTIADERSPVRFLSGSEATEAAFKRMAPVAELLHLATHGFFVSGDCPSGLGGSRGIGLLVPDSEVTLESTAELVRAQNPLLLSGLVLAGANRRDQIPPDEEDGILTAQEIAALDLSRVRWAVLSACETGTGEVLNGEGVFGLQRAFRIAGARTVITSLWSVRDEATRHWMNAFYRAGVGDGLEPVEAVHEASRAVLRDRRDRGEDLHPFYWGAFVASGAPSLP